VRRVTAGKKPFGGQENKITSKNKSGASSSKRKETFHNRGWGGGETGGISELKLSNISTGGNREIITKRLSVGGKSGGGGKCQCGGAGGGKQYSKKTLNRSPKKYEMCESTFGKESDRQKGSQRGPPEKRPSPKKPEPRVTFKTKTEKKEKHRRGKRYDKVDPKKPGDSHCTYPAALSKRKGKENKFLRGTVDKGRRPQEGRKIRLQKREDVPVGKKGGKGNALGLGKGIGEGKTTVVVSGPGSRISETKHVGGKEKNFNPLGGELWGE